MVFFNGHKYITMIIEYYATDHQDLQIEQALTNLVIKEWFNPEDYYYVLETDDDQVITILKLLGVDLYIAGERIRTVEANL